MKKKIIIVAIVVIAILLALAGNFILTMAKQTNNEDPTFWEKDIKKIESRYEEEKDVDIVFVGSSSIRKWGTLAEDFAEYDVVNHGFGGSKVADTTYYFDRLVTAFNPEAVVIFAGTNDIHGMTNSSKTSDAVYKLVMQMHKKAQQELPGIPVYYISISPTKVRWKVWDDVNKANQLIKEYAESQSDFTFIDTTTELIKDAYPNEELFVFDGLHLNEKGYALWTSIIKPIVTKTLN